MIGRSPPVSDIGGGVFVVDGLGALLVLALLTGIFLIGDTLGHKRGHADACAEHGLTKESAQLYTSAGRLLTRLAAVNDLDGLMAGDTLSPETKRQVDDWLATYRKGFTHA